jgi:hypothetical protein
LERLTLEESDRTDIIDNAQIKEILQQAVSISVCEMGKETAYDGEEIFDMTLCQKQNLRKDK